MNDLYLINPSKEYERQIQDYRHEYLDNNESSINGSCGLARNNNFDEWLDLVLSIKKNQLRNNVHASTFFSIRESDKKIIGTIQLRHSLTKELEEHGGQIGYAIRPTERKKGYGKEQLIQVLEIAKEMKMSQVMIICNKDNFASIKTVKACGGILTDENIYNDTEQQVYWIRLI